MTSCFQDQTAARIMAEYGQDPDEVVRGFVRDGESLRSVARILGLSRREGARLYDYYNPPVGTPIGVRFSVRHARGHRVKSNPVFVTGRGWIDRGALAGELGISRNLLNQRLRRGWRVR